MANQNLNTDKESLSSVEKEFENGIRPKQIEEFSGQPQIIETSGPVIEKPGDLAGLLTGLEPNDVLFIDEIHRLSTVVEEYLYSAMEDYRIDIMIDTGPSARSIQINLNPFTLVGATTRSGLLTAPLLSRFAIKSRLEYYDSTTLKNIL